MQFVRSAVSRVRLSNTFGIRRGLVVYSRCLSDPTDVATVASDDNGAQAAATSAALEPGAKEKFAAQQPIAKALQTNDYESVFKVCKEIKDAGVTPNVFTYNALLKAQQGANYYDASLSTFEELKRQKIAPNLQTFAILIRGLAKQNNVTAVEKLLVEMEKDFNIQPNAVIYSAVASAYVTAGEFKKALGLLDTMREKKIQPVNNMFATLLSAAVRLHDGKTSFSLLQQMDRNRVEISPHFVYLSMMLCVQSDEAEGALFTFRELGRVGKRIDTGALMQLLNMCARVGRADIATEVFQYWRQQEPEMPRIAYNALLHAYARAEKFELAFMLINEMTERGFVMHGGTMRHLVDAIASSAEQADRAYFVLLDMLEAQQKKIALPAMNAIVMACSKIGDLERAFATFAEYERFGLQPDIDTFNALLRGCAQLGKVNNAFRCLEEIFKAKLKPNAGTYSFLIAACVKDRNITRGVHTLHAMQREGLKPPADVFHTLVSASAHSGMHRLTRTLVEEMKVAGYTVPPALLRLSDKAAQHMQGETGGSAAT